MTASEDYCDFCDLPRSQCIHGQPPPPPPARPAKSAGSTRPATARPKAQPRKRAAATPEPPAKPVVRRWTPPEELKPLILTVLGGAGGALEADDLFAELETALEGRLRSGDTDLTPEGELRWRYAARRARVELINEGLMTKSRPGVWELARSRG